MHSGRGDTPQRVPGFPIRKPPDHSLAADSPGLIAGSNVLHRLLVPRHPPCALKNLAQQNYTLFHIAETGDARVHCAVLKIRAATAPGQRIRAGRSRSCPRPGRKRPCPQDPTACPPGAPPPPPFRTPFKGDRTSQENRKRDPVN